MNRPVRVKLPAAQSPSAGPPAIKGISVGELRILIEFEEPAEAKAAVAELRKKGARVDHRILGTASLWEVPAEYAPEVLQVLDGSVLAAGIRQRLQSLADRECRRRAA